MKQAQLTDALSQVGNASSCNDTEKHGKGVSIQNGEIEVKFDGDITLTQRTVSVSSGSAIIQNGGKTLLELTLDKNEDLQLTVGDIGKTMITLKYTSLVNDPCVYANNFAGKEFANKISGTMTFAGDEDGKSVEHTARVTASNNVLAKKAGKYNYATGELEWSIEVGKNDMAMDNVVLTDTLPNGLAYVDGSLTVSPSSGSAPSVQVDGQNLTIRLGKVSQPTTVTFRTKVLPSSSGLDQPVGNVKFSNKVEMQGSAFNKEFSGVTSQTEATIVNHGLNKSGVADRAQGIIDYQVLINPFKLVLKNTTVVDRPGAGIRIDPDTVKLYYATPTGDNTNNGKPSYTKGNEVNATSWTHSINAANKALTLTLPDSPTNATEGEVYLLEYRADITEAANSYSNSIALYMDGSEALGGGQTAETPLGGGGGGGGGIGSASNKRARIELKKVGNEGEVLQGARFSLHLCDDQGKPQREIEQKTTDANGELAFTALAGNKTYRLTEVQAPAGYDKNSCKLVGESAGVTQQPDGSLLISVGSGNVTVSLELENQRRASNGGIENGGNNGGSNGNENGGSSGNNGGSSSGNRPNPVDPKPEQPVEPIEPVEPTPEVPTEPVEPTPEVPTEPEQPTTPTTPTQPSEQPPSTGGGTTTTTQTGGSHTTPRDPNVPQTGDDTGALAMLFALFGFVLTGMTAWQRRPRGKHEKA